MPPASRLRRLASHVVPEAAPCGATATAAVLGALGGAVAAHFAHGWQVQRWLQQQQAQSEAEAAQAPSSSRPRPHAVTTEAELRALLPPRPTGIGEGVHGTGVADAVKVRPGPDSIETPNDGESAFFRRSRTCCQQPLAVLGVSSCTAFGSSSR